MSMPSSDPSSSPDPTTGAWRLGTWLGGKYRLDAVLGSGGMAVVYAATHRNKKRVAVKMLLETLSCRAEVRARFLREGYVANSVEHAGAVSVLDDDVSEDGTAYLVMELLQGQTVQEACRNAGGRLGANVTLSLVHQLLDTLAAAHSKNIVHRDIKPANLFMTHEGRLKVLDFGIARLREGNPNEANTVAGMSLGTPAFMAPEQAMGTVSEIDAQSDIWSVGATMFRLLSGRKVHVGETSQHLIMLAAMTPAPPLSSVVPEVDPRIAAMVDRALAFAKKDRYPSATAMRDEVGALYRSLYGDPGPGSTLTDPGSSVGVRTEMHVQPPPSRVSSADETGPSSIVGSGAGAHRSESSSPTTGGPVSSGPIGSTRRPLSRTPVLVAALGGAAVAVLVTIGFSRRSSPTPSASPSPSAATTAQPPPSEPAVTGTPMPPPTAQIDVDAGVAEEPHGNAGPSTPPSSRPRRPASSSPPSTRPQGAQPPAADFDRQ
jgi:serine/threonine-protein kinase